MPDIKNEVTAAIETLEHLYKHRGEPTGLPTGFEKLDEGIDGLHPGLLYVIAGRPCMGKTALAMNIAEHVAIEQQIPVAIFSLEMSSKKLIPRLLCSRARVDLQHLRNGFLAKGAIEKLSKAAAAFMQSKMFIDDAVELNLDILREKAIRIQGLGLIVIDHLELMLPHWKRGEKRRIEIAELSAGLKALAVELRVPIIVIAKLNRDSEERPYGLPHLSDLGKASAIGHYADVVGLLYRSHYYAKDEEEKAEKAGEAELIVAKNRDGNTGMICLTFHSEYQRFENRVD